MGISLVGVADPLEAITLSMNMYTLKGDHLIKGDHQKLAWFSSTIKDYS